MLANEEQFLKEAALTVRDAGERLFFTDEKFFVRCLSLEQDLLLMSASRRASPMRLQVPTLNMLVV